MVTDTGQIQQVPVPHSSHHQSQCMSRYSSPPSGRFCHYPGQKPVGHLGVHQWHRSAGVFLCLFCIMIFIIIIVINIIIIIIIVVIVMRLIVPFNDNNKTTPTITILTSIPMYLCCAVCDVAAFRCYIMLLCCGKGLHNYSWLSTYSMALLCNMVSR